MFFLPPFLHIFSRMIMTSFPISPSSPVPSENQLRSDQFARHIWPKFALSHFIQRRAHWQEIQTGESKKRKLFSDIIEWCCDHFCDLLMFLFSPYNQMKNNKKENISYFCVELIDNILSMAMSAIESFTVVTLDVPVRSNLATRGCWWNIYTQTLLFLMVQLFKWAEQHNLKFGIMKSIRKPSKDTQLTLHLFSNLILSVMFDW